jgi:hypothetical protein
MLGGGWVKVKGKRLRDKKPFPFPPSPLPFKEPSHESELGGLLTQKCASFGLFKGEGVKDKGFKTFPLSPLKSELLVNYEVQSNRDSCTYSALLGTAFIKFGRLANDPTRHIEGCYQLPLNYYDFLKDNSTY